MTRRLSNKEQVDIINAYTVDLVSAAELATKYGRTRQGVYKVLRRNGISPSDYGRLDLTCPACGAVFSRPRSQVKARRTLTCSMKCYYAWLEASQGGSCVHNRHGMRIARAKVSELFDLKPGNVVHHKDRNTLNNMVENLMVFATNGDHIRYHRLGPDAVTPIWDGEINK